MRADLSLVLFLLFLLQSSSFLVLKGIKTKRKEIFDPKNTRVNSASACVYVCGKGERERERERERQRSNII